ncbi:MAG TPA: hypothetical protein VFP92_08480 [Rhodanobacteraceae bacterium]|nr:hypothetical protein [Rhodanobacteraceae bacterium]
MTQADDARYPVVGPAVESRTQTPTSPDLSDWVDLMEVVEMLCPVWPERPAVAEEGAVYKL